CYTFFVQSNSICLAVFSANSNHKVTTHWEDIPDLRKSYPKLEVLENQRWVDEGNIITSGGISAGIDMSLHLVSKIHGLELAGKTAKQMEFDWTKNA
ncbi:MAG: DJ-1/PfpI family protein, partial [Cyanobacteria bacterium J06636_28]